MSIENATAKLPPELRSVEDVLEKGQLLDPAVWPEGDKVHNAEGARKIAGSVIAAFHSRLRGRSIAYLFVEKMGSGDRITLGTAAAANAKIRHIAEIDFILTFNYTAWQELSLAQRVALVDHELCHCDVDLESGKPTIIHHDVEEFGAIVTRHGLWKPDIRTFALSVKHALQGDLFG